MELYRPSYHALAHWIKSSPLKTNFQQLLVPFKKDAYQRSIWVLSSVHYNAESSAKLDLNSCYSILDVEASSTEEELRNAYLQKVKECHPDSSSSGDKEKFNLVQEAYHIALEIKRGQATSRQEEDILETLKNEQSRTFEHTVPQHRRYLTLEGIGSGTPSQRQRQYRQFKVLKASENVFEHRKMKHGTEENALVTKDKEQARKIKISNLIDRVVDDLIRESMQRGDFDNLSGKGKPIDHSDHNPFIDTTTHNLNRIMINNGFKPEWIMLSKEIRDSFQSARESLSILREQIGPPPYSEENELRWNYHVHVFTNSVKEINVKINKLNFIIPFMEKQMVHYDVNKNLQEIMKDHYKYLPKDDKGIPFRPPKLQPLPQVHAEDVRIKWGEVWANIKDVFKSR